MSNNSQFEPFSMPKETREDLWNIWRNTDYARAHGVDNPIVIDPTTGETESATQHVILFFSALFWYEEGRPFYRIYPGVMDFLLKLDLEKLLQFDFSELPYGLKTIEVEIPKEYWSIANMKSAVIYPDKEHVCSVITSLDNRQGGIWTRKSRLIRLLKDPDYLKEEIQCKGLRIDINLYSVILRLLLGVIAIGENTDIVKPLVLAKDREKYNATKDFKYIEKARRRGVFGFDVGKDIPTEEEFKKMTAENEEAERSGRVRPHIRMAHLALYHTGKGRTIPKMILRRESVVNKDLIEQMEKIPQGYYGKE